MIVMAIIWGIFLIAAVIVSIRPSKKVEWQCPSTEALTQHGENLLDERKAEIMAFRKAHEQFLEKRNVR